MRYFSVFGSFADGVVQRLEAPPAGLIALRGIAGSGKTTLFARVCQLMSDRGWTVLPYCGGNTERSTDAFDILTSLVWQLETITGQEHLEARQAFPALQSAAGELQFGASEEGGEGRLSLRQWQNRLEELCARAGEAGRVLIAVDALDQLQQSELRDLLGFLPARLSPQVRCFVTCLADYPLPVGTQALLMPAMDAAEQRAVVESILLSMGKELSAPVVEAILDKEQARNPLYLYLACARLSLMNAEDFQAIRDMGDGMAAITARHLEMIASLPEDLEGLSAALAAAVGERVEPGLAEAAFRYLALSRQGLRLTDLETLLTREGISFSALTFAQMVNYMNELFLLRSDGQYDFFHKSLRQGLRMGLTRRGTTLTAEHKKLLDHLWSLPEDDPLRVRDLLWESMEADDPLSFVRSITWLWDDMEKEPGRVAARDIAAFSSADGGDWVAACIARAPELDASDSEDWLRAILQLCFSIVMHLSPQFGDAMAELGLRLRLSGAAVDCLERVIRETPRPDYCSALSQCCRVYGLELLKAEDAALREKALPMLERSRALRQELLAEDSSAENQLRLSQIHSALSLLHFSEGTREGLEKALGCAREALAINRGITEPADAVGLLATRINSRMQIANTCIKLRDRPHLEEGYAHALACVEELEEIIRTDRSFSKLDTLQRCCTTLDMLCFYLAEQGTPEYKKASKRHALRALELAEECSRLRPTPETRWGLAGAWNNCARIYQAQEEVCWEQVFSCLEHSRSIYRALAQELGTPEMRQHYANILARTGETYESRGEEGDLLRGLDYFLQAAEEAGALARDTGALGHMGDQAIFLDRAAGVCQDLGGLERMKQAARLWARCEELQAERMALSPDPKIREDWYYVLKKLRKLGEKLMALGGAQAAKAAVFCCQTALRGRQELPEGLRPDLDQDSRRRARTGLVNACLAALPLLLEEAAQTDDVGIQSQRIHDTLSCGETMCAALREPGGESPTDEMRIAAACGFCAMSAAHGRLGGPAHLEESLRFLCLAQEELDQAVERNEYWYRTLCNVAANGRMAVQTLRPETWMGDPEYLQFAHAELEALRALTRQWDQDEDWQKLNRFCYHLGSIYDDSGDSPEAQAAALALYQEEASAGERRLALAEGFNQPEETLAALREDLSQTCYRVAGRLRKLGTEEALTQGLDYARRDVALSELLCQSDDRSKRQSDLAASWQQLGRIHATLGGETHSREALSCYQRELTLRAKLSQARPGTETTEDEALSCYRLSGLCQDIGGIELLLAARDYSRRDVALSASLLEAEPVPKRKRDLCASLIRARKAEEALGDDQAMAAAIAFQERVVKLRQELAAEAPSEKHLRELAEAQKALERLFGRYDSLS